ncbi:MAG: hypothetical protein KGI98_07650 [Euryarchaeota archaeon]|nr:hypothetical protein [Euryarchaeota archaeon]MDE1880135.1 hypothetical protein [Euryarchaeota archaeon]
MPIGAQRWALAATLVVLFVSMLAPASTAAPTSTNTLAIVVHLAGGSYAPKGVNVTLAAGSSGQTCTQTTQAGGMAVFFSGQADATGKVCWLNPGWYTAAVPPQDDRSSGGSVTLTILPGALGVSTDTFYASQSLLNSGGPLYLGGVTSLANTYTLSGSINVTGETNDNTTAVQVLDPSFPGLVFAQGSFIASYSFTRDLPAGTWTLYASSTLANGTTVTNYTQVTVPVARNTWNITLAPYLVQGYLFPTDHYLFTNQTNLTLYDTATGARYQFVNPASAGGSNFFQFGSYNSVVAPWTGSTRFLLLVAPQGKSTSWQYFTASPTGKGQNLQVHVTPLGAAPPTVESTAIAFNQSFGAAWVNSTQKLSNDSVIPQLPNAALGDLYAQVGVDYASGNINGTLSAWRSFESWLNLSGPIYPAQQSYLTVNGTDFSESGTFTHAYSGIPTDRTFNSTQVFWHYTNESYSLASAVTQKTSTHTLTMDFRYPTASQSLSYTVQLPKDWVLQAGTSVPAGTSLTAAGPGGTWSAFTLTSQYSPTLGATNGSATFNLVKVRNVTAVVNVNSPNFAFANKTNILSPTHNNYTVVVGLGQNVSFSAAGSIFPSGFNATSYLWNFGDGSSKPTYRTNTTAYHTYACPTGIAGCAALGRLNASVLLTANGGQRSWQNFTVLVDNAPPSPHISSNDTRGLVRLSSNDSMLRVNWSQSLRVNATYSNDSILSNGTKATLTSAQDWRLPMGKISDAIWNISAGPTYYTTNFSIGKQAASVYGNVTYQFNGAGTWNTTRVIDGNTYTVNGWLYKVVLKEYDAAGNAAYSTLYVIVNDTEKPRVVANVQGGSFFSPQNMEGKNVTSGTALSSGYCPISLVDKWTNDPHNGTVKNESWRIENTGWYSFNPVWFHPANGAAVATSVQVPQTASTVKSAAYNITLFVNDSAGNEANMTYAFTCQLNQTTTPILQLLNLTIQGGPSTLTEGQKYTLYVNVTNVGGTRSVANGTVVEFYYETLSGTGHTNLGTGTLYGFSGGVVNSNASNTNNLFYNVSFRAKIDWTVPGGGITGGLSAGQYNLCGNGTATNEPGKIYQSKSNIACKQVTINQSPLQQYFVAIVASVAVVVVLALVYFIYRRRTHGGSKKSAKPKKALEEEDEEEDEEKSSPKGGKDKDDDE